MTLKTDSGKIAYWTIMIVAIVVTFVLSIVYIASTSMRKAVLARNLEGKVYMVDTRGYCGKCDSDIWYFYDENGSLERVIAPVLKNDYMFVQVWFNRNHYNKKTKTFTFGSYSDTFHRVFSKDFYLESTSNDSGFKVYKELDSGFEGKRWFSLLFWAILSSFFIAFPLVHIRPSKECFAELMKYASYVDTSDRVVLHFKDDKLQVDIWGTRDEICFSEVYYKGDKVARNVYVLSDGTLKNVYTREYYWIKRATKSILPAFKNKMVESKIEHIL